MNVIKINATNSTNSYLKEISLISRLDNFTVVVAQQQLKGRGQHHTKWHSEPGKNLTFSVLIRPKNLNVSDYFYLSIAVSNAIHKICKTYNVPKLKIKWPNDIMASDYKIGGILIENVIKNTFIESSIVGVGLNVNQLIFPKELYAKSLSNLLGKSFNLDALLIIIIDSLKLEIQKLNNHQFDALKNDYLAALYKKNIPAFFQNILTGKRFMGKIVDVNQAGMLMIENDDQTIKHYNLKEISIVRL